VSEINLRELSDENVELAIHSLVEQMVGCLVDDIDNVKIVPTTGSRTTVINITVNKSDVGKVIGKQGRIISAMRTICENIASKFKKRVDIHVID